MGLCTIDNTFNQASFSKPVWSLVRSIMDEFEDGNLKDQTLTAKSLFKRPEFKQQYLSCIQCLPDEFKAENLQKVLDRELTSKELKEKADDYRLKKSVQKAFCKISNTSWKRQRDDSLITRLDPFKCAISGKVVSDSFIAFFQGALQTERVDIAGSSLDVMNVRSCGAYLLEGNIFEMCCGDIRKVHSTFMGANLFIAHVQKVTLPSLYNII